MSETEAVNTENTPITQTPSKRKSISPPDEIIATPGKRERKQATVFQLETPVKNIINSATKREGVNGTGKPLGDFEHFNINITKFTSDDEILQNLFFLCYNCRGRRVEIKRLLRQFNGFENDLIESRTEKVTEKKFWTTVNLKSALGLLGLEKGGDRPTLIERLIKFLAHPNDESISSRASTIKSKKRKTSNKSDTPRRVSPYLLFANEHRQTIKEENPEFKFGDIGRKLGSMWAELSEEEKNVWIEKSKNKEAEEEDDENESDEAEDEDQDEDQESKKKKSRNSISPQTPSKSPVTPSKSKTPKKTPSKTPSKSPKKTPLKEEAEEETESNQEKENLDEQLNEIFGEDNADI